MPPQHFRLGAAKQSAFDAWRQLDRFIEANDLWPVIGEEFPETGGALVQRFQALKSIQKSLMCSFEQLLTETGAVPAAWKAHQDFLASAPRSQQVTSDRQVGQAMAALLEAGNGDQVHAMIDALGLAPNGPAGARWALEARYRTLWWVPVAETFDDDDSEDDFPEENDAFEPEDGDEAGIDPWANAAPATDVAPGQAASGTDDDQEPAPNGPEAAAPGTETGDDRGAPGMTEAERSRSLEVVVGAAPGERILTDRGAGDQHDSVDRSEADRAAATATQPHAAAAVASRGQETGAAEANG